MAQTKPDAQARQSARWPDQMPNPNERPEDRLAITTPAYGLMNLRSQQDIASIMNRYFGAALPATANSFTTRGARRAVWLGPDESLLICSEHEAKELYLSLSTQLAGRHFALTLISDALAVYQLEGVHVRDILAKGCALDLHASIFGPGRCAQSSLDRAAVTLMCDADNSFCLICRTSFADYVESWLKDASVEFGYAMK